jgi:hypothetical protein
VAEEEHVHEADNNEALTRQARFYARRMKKALEPLRSVHRTISLQLAVTYLHVTLDEGAHSFHAGNEVQRE